jgi:hypothetical protein
VKDLYRRFRVSSRAELMARWVRQDGAHPPLAALPSAIATTPAKKRPSQRARAASSRR